MFQGVVRKEMKRIRSITFTEDKIMQVAHDDDTIDRRVGHKVDKFTIARRFVFNPQTEEDHRKNREYLIYHNLLEDEK